MSEFEGFPISGLKFLTTLGTKDKAWFDDNKKLYQSDVVAPAKAFVEALGESLRETISPAIEAQPKTNGSIAPINNDLRFSPDASPYKDHLMFRFWEGPTKKIAPTLFVRMHPTDGVGFASGINIGDIDRWRQAIDERGEPFAAELDRLVADLDVDVVGEGLKKVPKPYEPDHPRAALLRHKGFQVRWIAQPESISEPGFVDWCADMLDNVSAVHHWLVAELA